MRRLFFSIFLILAMSAGICAAEKITQDPNAGPQVEQAEEPGDIYTADARLSRKITFSAPRKMVSEILADLSKQTGITFRAGYNSQDWQVRDRRMNVFVKDLPLKDLMQSITRVMKFKWSRGGDAPNYSYRLYMDRRALLDAETKRLRADEQLRQDQVRNRAEMLAKYSRLSDMSPEEMAKLKENDPYTYALTKMGVTQGIGKFFGEMPGAAEAMAGGQQVMFGAGDVSPAALQGLVSFLQASKRVEAVMGGKEPGPDEPVGDTSKLSVVINDQSLFGEMFSGPQYSFILGVVTIWNGNRMFPIMMMKPDSGIARAIGKMLIRAEEEKKPLQEVMKSSMGELTDGGKSDVKMMDWGEPPIDHSKDPDDPDLNRKIKVEADGPWLEDALSALSSGSGLAVVSDAFGRLPAKSPGDEMEIKKAIELITDPLYNWEKHGKAIECRTRNWYRNRLNQIPQAWIDGWARVFKKSGALDLPELAQIAALTQEQFLANLVGEDPFKDSDLLQTYMISKDLLRAYGSLSDAQRAVLLSGGPLDLAACTPDQLQRFSNLMRTPKLLSTAKDVQRTLTMKSAQQDKQTTYIFKLVSSDSDQPVQWTIQLPVLNPPGKNRFPGPSEADTPKQEGMK